MRDADTNGFLEARKSRLFVQNASLLIGIEKEKRGGKRMDYEELQILAQLVNAMEESYTKMEQSYLKKDIASFKKAKEAILNFQKQISQLMASSEENQK